MVTVGEKDRRRAGSGGVVMGGRPDDEDVLRLASSDANGEEVKNGMERFQLAQMVRASIAGLGFAMSVIGIWGDGF